MATITPARATIDDLYNTEGKAELIGGRIVEYMATGYLPSRVAGKIYRFLDDYSEEKAQGIAATDNLGYVVTELRSGRETFSPDASYYKGPLPANRLRFIPGPPTLAVEVRSEGDYGPAAEREMAAKRADYFEAGTQVVWDVDTVDEVIRVYRSDRPDTPTTYGRGQVAEAEPAVPGWRVAVDDLFPAD
jgi:Uma2 family endonuclease